MPQLIWLGDAQAKHSARRVPYRLLEPVAQVGEANAPNWLIQGDNLDALKALLPFHAGRVKCIFIDPPYNTRSAFEHYDDNLEHSQWLSMMYPRLELLRDLLAEDGSIWVTIDDNEAHYLKVMMDEVFGRGNFVATLIWEKADSPRNSARQFSTDHDYIHVFARNCAWAPIKLPRSEEADSIYANPDNDERGPWLPGDPYANKPYSKGQYSITGPTGRMFSPPPGRFWRTSEQRLRALDEDGRIWWGPNGNARPSIKRYLSEVSDLVPRTLWGKDAVGSRLSALVLEGRRQAYQRSLLGGPVGVRLSDRYVFTFSPEPTDYPARWSFGGRWVFNKHYYPRPGELDDDIEQEETACAIELDRMDEVAFWVRNLECQPEKSFWLPTSHDRFYPDFVAQLNDGRLFVVEYKGAHLWDGAQEDRDIGAVWATASERRCVFLMATAPAIAGRSMSAQLRAAVRENRLPENDCRGSLGRA